MRRVVRCNLRSDCAFDKKHSCQLLHQGDVLQSRLSSLWSSGQTSADRRCVIWPEGGVLRRPWPWLGRDSLIAWRPPLHRCTSCLHRCRGRGCTTITTEAFIESSTVNTSRRRRRRRSAAVCEVDRSVNWSRRWRLRRRVHSKRYYYFSMIENTQRVVFILIVHSRLIRLEIIGVLF